MPVKSTRTGGGCRNFAFHSSLEDGARFAITKADHVNEVRLA
jgi:hypothetical protein